MLEKPKTLEETRVEDFESILDGNFRADCKTEHGIFNLSKQPDCYTLRIVDEYSRPLALFKIGFSGQIVGELDKNNIKVWKDEEEEIPLTPEDLIEAFYRTKT